MTHPLYLDTLIAEKVMGCINPREFDLLTDSDKPLFQLDQYPSGPLRSEPYSLFGLKGKFGHQWYPFRPSSSIADAFFVVEEMRKRGYAATIVSHKLESGWTVTFSKELSPSSGWTSAGCCTDASAARAICIAALHAVGVQL